MWDASPQLRRLVEGCHDLTYVVDVLRGTDLAGANVPVVSASVTADVTTSDGRTASLVVDRTLTDTGLFDPLSDTVVIRAGVPGVELVPLFTGRVDAVAETNTGEVAVALLSRRQELARAAFETPFVGRAGAPFVDEITRAVQDVDPDWAVDRSQIPTSHMHTLTDVLPAGLVWEDDRARAISDMADAIHVLWPPNRTGGFVLLTSHFTEVATHEPAAVLRDGVDGVLVGLSHVRSRQDIYNSVTVVVERTDNSPPIRVIARDDADGSPTQWGGLFGKQNRIVKIDTPATVDDAADLAARMLASSLALARSWRIEIPDNPLIDPGDIVGVWYRGEPTMQYVESIACSSDTSRPTVLATRLIS